MRRLLAVLFSMALALAAVPDLAELNRMIARFAPVPVTADTSKLAPGDRQALAKLLEAANVIDHIFRDQLYSGNVALGDRLAQDETPLGKARYHYYRINNGPWSDLDDHAAFVPGVPSRKPPGANFYPEDMTKAEFEAWLKKLSKSQQDEATGFFTVIQRAPNRTLTIVPYSQAYAGDLARLAALLNQAANLTPNESLKNFLHLRAQAFVSNDYYASDVAWMKLDAPIDVTIGPYETYNDDIFGYKAAFEAYVTLRDEQETAKLKMFADHIQEIENNLPLDAKYRNPKLGALAPIRVVNQIVATGDGAHGVRTAAFNLPNDERIVKEMGSKRVMLKNVQEAKFEKILEPIAARVLAPQDRKDVKFDAFFTHILAHEMTHGIGPQNGVRQALKEQHSAIEEAKADVTGLFMMQYLLDHKLLPGSGAETERALYTTFLASSFRTLRFGVHEAHGKGMALQFNYLTDKGAFVAKPDGTFAVDPSKIKVAVRDLVHDLLAIEATGDYAGAKKMLDSLGNLRPPMQKALDRLQDLPTDIEPVAR
jgi:Peptidase family M49